MRRLSLLRRLSSADPEAGSATVFVVMFAVVLLALAGLVIDGGLAINARERVTDDVEQAARAGSKDLNVAGLRATGIVEIEPGQAAADACRFLTLRKYSSNQIHVSATTNQVTVSAQTQQRTTLLSLIGITDFTIRAQGQARPSVGIATGSGPATGTGIGESTCGRGTFGSGTLGAATLGSDSTTSNGELLP